MVAMIVSLPEKALSRKHRRPSAGRRRARPSHFWRGERGRFRVPRDGGATAVLAAGPTRAGGKPGVEHAHRRAADRAARRPRARTCAFLEIVRRHEILRTTFHCEKGQLQQVIAPESCTCPSRWWTCAIFPRPSGRACPSTSWPRRPSAVRPRAGPGDPRPAGTACRRRNTSYLSPSTTSFPMAGATAWCCANWASCTPPSCRASRRRCPTCRSNSPIMPSGSRIRRRKPVSATRWPTGGKRSRANCPCSICPPTAHAARRAAGRRRAAQRRETLAAPLVQSLKALAVREGVSVYMLYLAVYAALLARHGGREDILVVSPSANRDRSEVEGLIGPFVNPLLLRLDLSGGPTFRELLGRVRRVVLGAFEHAAAPFEKVLGRTPAAPAPGQFSVPEQLPPARPAARIGTDLAADRGRSRQHHRVERRRGRGRRGNAAFHRVHHGAFRRRDHRPRAGRIPAAARSRRRAGGLGRARHGTAAGIRSPNRRPESVLLADRWRLPAESVRWMDGCFETAEGVFGRARRGVEVFVLDDHLQPAPAGVAGEMYVRGVPEAVKTTLAAPTWVEHPRLGTGARHGRPRAPIA